MLNNKILTTSIKYIVDFERFTVKVVKWFHFLVREIVLLILFLFSTF